MAKYKKTDGTSTVVGAGGRIVTNIAQSKTPSSGAGLVQARQDRLRSGAYGTHEDRRTKRNRSRSDSRRAAISESTGR
jgi:hypothetical protein